MVPSLGYPLELSRELWKILVPGPLSIASKSEYLGRILGNAMFCISKVDSNVWPQLRTPALHASISLALSVLHLMGFRPWALCVFLEHRRSFLLQALPLPPPACIVLSLLFSWLALSRYSGHHTKSFPECCV